MENRDMEIDASMLFSFITLLFSTFLPNEKVLESDREQKKLHRTYGIRQQVKIVYSRTGFIVEALPHI